MEKYSFTYQSVSSYGANVRSQTRESVPKPFVPFIPKTNGNSEGHVVKKTIVPVASRPYEDDYDTRSSPARYGDDEMKRQTSPLHGSPRRVDDFPTKVHNEARNPARFSPLTPTANGYGDYGSNKEGHRPIGGIIKRDNHDGYNNGTSNGYRDYGRNKEGTKPIGGTIKNYDGHGDYGRNKEGTKPIGGNIKNYDDHDGYDSTGYGDYGRSREGSKPVGGKSEPHDGFNGINGYGNHGSNKEQRKPFGGIGTIRDHDNHNSYNGTNVYGDYGNNGNKERRNPIEGIIRNYGTHDGYNGTNGYSNNKEGRKPIGGTIRNYDDHDGYNGTNGYGDGYGNNKERRNPLGGTIRNYDNHDDYNGTNGYGDGYGNREGRKPIGGTIRSENHDGYNGTNGYGDYYGNKEGHKPIGSPNKYDNHDGYNGRNGYGDQNNKEVLIKPMVNSGGWSKPNFGFGWTAAPRKGTQLSEPISDIGAAMELLKKEAAKMTLNDHSNKEHYDNYQRRHDGSSPLNNLARPPGNGSRLSDPISKYDKDDYGESIDKRAAMRPYGDSNLSPRPRSSTHVAVFNPDHRDIDTGHYRIMDSTEAEKRFKGTRIS